MLYPARSFFFLLLLCACTLSAQQNQPQSSERSAASASAAQTVPRVSVTNDVEYGVADGQKLLLDLYMPAEPASKPRAAIVLIHGGGWTSGGKDGLSGMGNFLARWGFVAAAIDYRLLQGNQNRWPVQLDDAQTAVRWLRANAAKYNIDPDRIGAFGHSAGAQLASLLGMEDTREKSAPQAKYSSRVQAVVDVAGPADFLTDHDPEGDAQLAQFFGTDYRKNPAPWRDASPVDHVAKSNAPFLIIQGTKDNAVPPTQSEELYDKLHAAGVQVTLVKLDTGHMFEAPDARRQLALETLKFFNQYLVVNP